MEESNRYSNKFKKKQNVEYSEDNKKKSSQYKRPKYKQIREEDYVWEKEKEVKFIR